MYELDDDSNDSLNSSVLGLRNEKVEGVPNEGRSVKPFCLNNMKGFEYHPRRKKKGKAARATA